MAGFSADWLSLREPADHRARDTGLVARLAAWVAARSSVSILDLGCGTGSNARALIPNLGSTQHWRLADHDRALLDIAAEKLAAHSAVTVATEEADLSHGIEALLDEPCHLVTAAALFDLVSREWLDAMVAALAARRLPLYTSLMYDGVMEWDPPHPADQPIRDAFNNHQHGDKGFGPAAGPAAAAHLTTRLSQAGYEVATAPSPWQLGPDDHRLMIANAVGVANAVWQTGQLPESELAGWLAFRREGARCTIGHLDLLAFPPG